jgi:hypothetical protein
VLSDVRTNSQLINQSSTSRKPATERDSTMADSAHDPRAAQQVPPQQPIIEADDLQPLYANFCRVASTPEELVLDFGLNTNPYGNATIPVKVTGRLVVNYYTAKRIWLALRRALEMHEQAFGVIEIDVNKRAQPPAITPSQG